MEQRMLDAFRDDPKGLAEQFLVERFGAEGPILPVNPFQMLTEAGAHFVFRPFHKLEGLFFPADGSDDIDLVAINSDRPITRQRYSAAHELCHLLKDRNVSGGSIACYSWSSDPIERYAEEFACALLMPRQKMVEAISHERNLYGRVDLDGILRISYQFGVSFEACYYRVRELAAPDVPHWNKHASSYRPIRRAKELELNHNSLLIDMLDSWEDILLRCASPFALQVFKTDYIYNDNRLEGIEVNRELTAEIVHDLIDKTQHSVYCNLQNDAYCNVAGHSNMYDMVFSSYSDGQPLTIFKLFDLNRQLFSCVPHPEYGGSVRQANTLVMGARFDTVDRSDIFPELMRLNDHVAYLEGHWKEMRRSDIVKAVAYIHHRITVIHPFSDGNGRTSRAFANLMLLRYDLLPFRVDTDSRDKYLHTLEIADLTGDATELCLFMINQMIASSSELSRWSGA